MSRRSTLYPCPRLVAALVAALAGGCATEPDPLDRTQPEAVRKAIFDGTWIYNLTVTDADWENRFTFVGEQTATYMGKAFKVRWEVTQDRLNAYMVPQVYRDKDGNPVENKVGQKSLILSFAIKKHYDIRYRYNSTTREELNIIEENTDRPWREREYMEVDWSRNLTTNIWDPTATEVKVGALERENVAVYENVDFYGRGATKDEDVKVDPRRFQPGVDPEVYLINIDTKESISSKLTSVYQLYYGSHLEPTTVRFRHSLMKMPAGGTGYQPLDYRDDAFRRFGFFRTEYEVYDGDRHLPTESTKRYFVNRWDVSGEKQIVWYLSPAMQEAIDAGDTDLRTWAQEVCDSWNATFQEATGRKDRIVLFKENSPLTDAEGKALTRADGTKRWKYELGDLRYPMINVTFKQGLGQPGGYGPSTPDPDTGEILHAGVNVYGGWLEWVVQRALDQYDVASGHCTLEQMKDGRYFNPKTGKCDAGVSDVALNGPSGPAIAAGSGAGAGGTTNGKKELGSLRFLSPALRTAYYPRGGLQALPAGFQQQLAAAEPMLKKLHQWELTHPTTVDLSGFKTVAGSKLESSLLPQGQLGSLLPGAASAGDASVLAALSPAQRLSAEGLRLMKEESLRELSVRDEPTMFEPAIHGFVEEMKGKPRAEVEKTLRHWVFFTCMLHEMGHTLGLRHNFSASADERNFPPEYAKLKTAYWDKVDALRKQYQALIQKGDTAAYEAYVKKVDDLPSIHDRFGSSSVMDYMGDWMDWGTVTRPYDRAALLFGYGQKVEIKNGKGQWEVAPYKKGDFDVVDPLSTTEQAKSGRYVRSYLFCSDEKTYDDAFCTPFDRGTTATEIVRNFIRDAQVSYFFSNFKRDRTSFEKSRRGYYMQKWLRQYYMFAKPFAQLTLNSMRYPEFWSSIWDGVNALAQGPETRAMKPGYFRDGGEDLLRASLLYYNFLLFDVLMRPDYGHHQLKTDTSGAKFWEATKEQYLDAAKPSFFLPAGAGWGFTDRWDIQQDSGRYYEHLQRIGVEVDKLVALEVLSIPMALSAPLSYEKANGGSFWNSLWTGNGSQLWQVARGLVTDNFSHTQNPWCVRCDAACRANPKLSPPTLVAHPVDPLEGLASAGVFTNYPLPTGKNRCGQDEEPVQPGMDALFAIKPIFFAIAGASHPWYHNALVEKLDSQVKGGAHRFEIPAGAEVAEFVNPSGTKTYQAVQTEDKLSISYQLVDTARRIRNRIDLSTACLKNQDPKGLLGSLGTNNRTCAEVTPCFGKNPPAYCESEGWDSSFSLEALKYRDLDRIEAMLIMMQDMIDLAGHYAWRVPGYFGGE
jgi:hypothetical protein